MKNDLLSTCRQAEALLGEALQAQLHLDVVEQFDSSHLVMRCAVSGGPPGKTPQSIIVKQRAVDKPQQAGDFDQNILFANEWASLDFLAGLGLSPEIGPRLYASDRAAGLVILQDLGSAQSVQDALYGNDRAAAVAALTETGSLLGRLQGAAYHRETDFSARQATLGTQTTTCDASLDLRRELPALHACLKGLGIAAGQQFDTSLIELERAIHGPEPYRSFVHNDAGAHNFMITSEGVRLLDFEFAGYGLGLLDAVCARLAYPPAFRGRISPPEVVDELESRYRAELSARVPGLGDAERFAEAAAQACAHWAFSKLNGFWNAYLRERLVEGEARDSRGGRDPARAAFFRRQVFTYLRLTLATLEEGQHLPAIRQTLAQVVDRLLAVWPETPLLDTYPVFGGEAWHYP